MKIDTIVIITKGVCYAGAGWCAGFAGSTAQYLNTDVVPSKLAWGVIFAAAFGGAFTNLLAFLSNSFRSYQDKMAGERTETVPNTEPPKPEPAKP